MSSESHGKVHTHKELMLVLSGLMTGMFLAALDQTIVSTAMPRIVSDLSGLERYTWVTTIYLLISTLLVPIYGKLSDIRSRRGLEIWSVVVFLIGSMLCGLAGEFGPLPLLGDGMNQLIVFRGIQAVGGAGIFALAFIIVSDLYPPRERGKINGMFGAVFGLSSVFGPLIGGFLTDNAGAWIPGIAGWHWVFYVNLPIGAVALWFIITKMPHLHAHDKSHKMDFLSAFLMLSAFFPLVLGLQLDKTTYPWTSPTIISLLGGSALMMAIWIWHSFRSQHPIINLRLFSNKVFWTSNLAVFFFGASFMAVIIFLPLYMVNVMGVSATGAGASIIPMSLGIVVGAQVSGMFVTKLGKYKGIMIIGSSIAVLAGILLATLGANSPMWLAIIFMVIAGIGFGPSQSIYALAIQNSMKPQEVGQATSTVQFSRQIGSAVGAAILGVIFTTTLSTAFVTNLPTSSSSSTPAQQSRLNSEGPKEIRAGFDRVIERIDPLFALRGEAAESGLKAFLADPAWSDSTRNQLQTQFKDGTPAMAIAKGFKAFVDPLGTAFLAGDSGLVQQILAKASENGRDGQPGPAANIPDFVKAMLVKQAALPDASARQAAWQRTNTQFATQETTVVDEVSSTAATAAKKGLAETRDKLVNGITKSFAEAIGKTWFANAFIMFAMFLITFFIPSLKLRGRGESVTQAAEEPKP